MATQDIQSEEIQSLRPFRAGLTFGFFNAMAWQVALGTPMVLFAERLGASAFEVGLAYAFVFVMTPIQILATALLPRMGFKRLMMLGWGSRAIFLVPPVLLAFVAPHTPLPWMVMVFIGSLFFFCLMRAVGSCAYVPWMYSLLPRSMRGRYFASDQLFSGIAGVGTLLLCALLFYLLPLYKAFLIEYVFALGGSVLALIALSRLQDGPRPATIRTREVVMATPRLVTEPGPFRRFLYISLVFNCAVAAIPPFCAYFLKVGPHLSPAHILLLTTCQYVGVISGSALIRNRIDSTGPKSFFQISTVMYVLVGLYWIAYIRGWIGGFSTLPIIYIVLGQAASFWFSSNLSYLPQITNDEDRTLAVSVHSAFTSLVGGLSPIIWGLFLKSGTGAVPGMDSNVFQLFFVVVLFTSVILFFVMGRLPVPAEGGRRIQLGSLIFRPFRALTYLADLVSVESLGLRGRKEPPKSRTDSN